MKGVEGLALKYIVVILVAALVIGVVYTVVSSFTGMLTVGSAGLSSTVEGGMNQTNADACESFGCTWNATTQLCSC